MSRKGVETWGIPDARFGTVRAAPAAIEASRKVLRVGMIDLRGLGRIGEVGAGGQ